jgi:hypothetical protein
MKHPSSPRKRTKAAVGLTLAAGLAATGITVAVAEEADGPALATDDQVVDVRSQTDSLVSELDRVDALTDYAVHAAARRYSIAVYLKRMEWQGAAAYAEALAASQAAAATYSGSSGSSSLDAIRACESGGDYGAVSSSGTYRGAYQFDYATWQSVGGSGDPAAASPAEQDMRAQMLYDQAGSSPWPVCGS